MREKVQFGETAMAPSEIRDLLTATPFVPFRIITSDGTVSYDVPDPHQVIVTNRSVHVGILANPGDVIADRIIRLDLLHITQLIPLVSPPTPHGNGQAGG
jgi:hypothetical protein